MTQPSGRMRSVRLRTLTYLPAYVVPAVLGLAVVPALTRLLGTEQFGVYAVCLSVHGCLLALAADPTTGSLTRFYAMAETEEARARLIKALLGFCLAIGAAVLTTGLAVAIAVALVSDVGTWLAALTATAVMTFFYTVFQYLLTVRYVQERALATSTSQVTHAVGKATALIAGAAAAGTAAGSLAAYGAVCVMLVAWMSRGVVSLPGPLREPARWRRAIAYGGPLIVMSLSWVALAGFDRAVLAAIDGEAAAGRYAAAYLIAEGAVSVPAMLLRYAVYTSVVEAYERGDESRARLLLRKACDGVLLTACAVVLVISLYGGDIVRLVGGEGFDVPNAVPGVIAVGIAAYRLGGLESIGFQLVLDSKGLAGTFLTATAVAIPVTVVLVAVDGLDGAALATLLAYTAFYGLIRWRSPVAAITRYPATRLAAAAAATGGFVALGLLISAPLALAAGAVPAAVMASRLALGRR